MLADPQVVQLATLGRQIEAHFGCPQDIEWCLVDGGFQIVQSRPITTLFPVPERDDAENHVYVSVGHGQMMTDPMKPLGLSMWKLTALPPMYVAGGRLFVDVTRTPGITGEPARPPRSLRTGATRSSGTRCKRCSTAVTSSRGSPTTPPPVRHLVSRRASIETDPAIVTELIARAEESIAAVQRDIQTRSGTALLDFILEDLPEMKRILFDPLSQQAIMAGMEATWWLNDQLQEWLGEKNAADILTRSAPNNVTSEMGLDLLDVADVIRPHPDVVEFLRHVHDDDEFLDDDALTKLEGGAEARDAIRAYLDSYGMRCVGEIDITRPRWSEHPTALVPVILGNIKSFEPGEAHRRFERGKREAQEKEVELLERLRDLPDGEQKADETKRMIDRVRTFIGYREYPKYSMISRYFIYKRALLEEAERLVQAQVLREREDIFFLTFEELHDVVSAQHADDELIQQRKTRFRVVPRPHATPGAHVGWRGHRRVVPTRRPTAWRTGRLGSLRRNRRGPSARHPRYGGRRRRGGRHPGDCAHRPQLVAAVRRDQGPGDRGRRSHDARRSDRPGVRPVRRRGGRARHAVDRGRPEDPAERNRRVRRAPRDQSMTRITHNWRRWLRSPKHGIARGVAVFGSPGFQKDPGRAGRPACGLQSAASVG